MIIGHEDIIADLATLASAQPPRLGHGYIFFGASMVGKRTTAVGLGYFLEKGDFALPEGEAVLQDTMVVDRDFMRTINPDAKDSIGIDAVREIKNFLWQKPMASARRTLIIDDAELMTTEAQNALLKITEEPPASSLLILVTSDIESILPTIASRLPRIYFGAVPEAAIAKWLGDPKAAKRALGKPGLAWRFVHDEAFQGQLATAEAFLKTTAAGRRDFIKKLIEPEDFSLRNFLGAVIMTLAWETPSKAKAAFWHKALRLYENANRFGLNPRLQLEALMR